MPSSAPQAGPTPQRQQANPDNTRADRILSSPDKIQVRQSASRAPAAGSAIYADSTESRKQSGRAANSWLLHLLSLWALGNLPAALTLIILAATCGCLLAGSRLRGSISRKTYRTLLQTAIECADPPAAPGAAFAHKSSTMPKKPACACLLCGLRSRNDRELKSPVVSVFILSCQPLPPPAVHPHVTPKTRYLCGAQEGSHASCGGRGGCVLRWAQRG